MDWKKEWKTLAAIIVVFVGFARTFFLRFWFPEAESFAASERIFYVHGVFFTAWIVFLVMQAMLVRAGRVQLHRTLGWLGAAIAACVVLLGLYGASVAAQRPGGFIGVPLPPLQFLVVPFFDMVLFGLSTRHVSTSIALGGSGISSPSR